MKPLTSRRLSRPQAAAGLHLRLWCHRRWRAWANSMRPHCSTTQKSTGRASKHTSHYYCRWWRASTACRVGHTYFIPSVEQPCSSTQKDPRRLISIALHAQVVSCPNGLAVGHTYFIPSEEHLESGVTTRGFMEAKLVVSLAGRWVCNHLRCLELATGSKFWFQEGRPPPAASWMPSSSSLAGRCASHEIQPDMIWLNLRECQYLPAASWRPSSSSPLPAGAPGSIRYVRFDA